MGALLKVGPGKGAPEQVNVVIEIPSQGDPVKYEIDKETGVVSVDRFLSTAMRYPCNYGYIPGTLSADGDPVDALVVAPFPLLTGSLICCRPLGLLTMEDESGNDVKILAVPIDKLSAVYQLVKTWKDLPESLIKSIRHFFEHYKDLESGKWVKMGDWQGVEAAEKEIQIGINKYQKR